MDKGVLRWAVPGSSCCCMSVRMAGVGLSLLAGVYSGLVASGLGVTLKRTLVLTLRSNTWLPMSSPERSGPSERTESTSIRDDARFGRVSCKKPGLK